ncbi:hypothetical protein ACIBCN_30910 [Nocardia sp. NPDC051052]|uniref:hypothetical protein n=1 Tax=Nocardia sp. NPDC051052 TaxID=3364322 RepID=UPI0037A141D7
MMNAARAVRVVAAADAAREIGRQGQHLVPCITRETTGSQGISAGMVNMPPYTHGPGDFVYIPEGVVQAAVNLSETDDLVAVEMRTDPMFNDDVVLVPDHDRAVAAAVARLRRDLAVAGAGR